MIFVVGAYLAGSVPFGVLISRSLGCDIRKSGSGNIGATNLGRVCGKKWGIGCFVLDLLKGLLPVLGYGLVAVWPGRGPEVGGAGAVGLWMVVASATVVGHVAPVWLGFKGGKGVATSAGALLGVWPVLTVAGLLGAVVWFAVVKLTGYVGLASVAAAVALPGLAAAVALAMGRPAAEIVAYAGVATGLALLVVWRHRSNLRNLRAGIEPRAAWTGRG